jgi:hypothetical protein
MLQELREDPGGGKQSAFKAASNLLHASETLALESTRARKLLCRAARLVHQSANNLKGELAEARSAAWRILCRSDARFLMGSGALRNVASPSSCHAEELHAPLTQLRFRSLASQPTRAASHKKAPLPDIPIYSAVALLLGGR